MPDLPEAGTKLFLEAGPSTLALAGGTTPRPLYERLARAPFSWERVEVFFGDERCVPLWHPDSNFRMASDALLGRVQARVHPVRSCEPEDYERDLAEVFGPGVPRFDLIFLGLGEDGHTASLFPGDPAASITDRLVARVERPDHPRITLTLLVLSAARLVVFLVAGEAKRAALASLAAGDDIPAAKVVADRVVVLADHSAAPPR